MIPFGPQVEVLVDQLLDLVVGDLAGAFGVDRHVHRPGDADRVGDLDLALPRQPGGDDVLGDVARRVGGRAVDLRRVLAGERAAAVRAGAAVGVDDDLAAGQAAVALRAADDEAAGRVDQVLGLLQPLLRQHRLDDLLDHRLDERAPSSSSASRSGSGRAGSTARRCRSSAACRRRSASSPGSSRPGAGTACGRPCAAAPGARPGGARSRSAPASGRASRRRRSRTSGPGRRRRC